jgi:hypothetical protein
MSDCNYCDQQIHDYLCLIHVSTRDESGKKITFNFCSIGCAVNFFKEDHGVCVRMNPND